MLSDGVHFLQENHQVGNIDQRIEAVFLPVICPSCKLQQIVELEESGADSHERAMGPEVITGFYAETECLGCRSDLAASVDLAEYPIGALGTYNLAGERGTKLLAVPGLEQMISTLRRVSPFSWGLRTELSELHELLGFMGKQAPGLAKILDRLIAARMNCVAVFGSYKEEHKPRLHQIRSAVIANGREAVITDEVPKTSGDFVRDASRFVAAITKLTILYDKEPSGGNNEAEIIVGLERPLAILREKDHHGSSRMLDGLAAKHTFVKVFHIEPDLKTAVRSILEWADALVDSWERKAST